MSNWLKQEIKDYTKNHQKSLTAWKKANELFPAGVSHNIRDFHMTPLGLGPPFISKAEGTRLTDIDDNSYIDYWLTHGAAILGHAHKAIIEAITKQLHLGNHYGMVNEQALVLARKICEATPSIEKLRFCTTGTEATMYASRLARAFTKKKKIAKVRGGWHGGNDTLFYYVKHVEKGIESNGLKSQEEAEIVSFDYNDIEGFKKVLKENKNEISAVVMEPVLGAGGAIQPREGFLETVREETERNDIILIYDEIITGFRLSFNSGQGYFGVTPDMTTMGKIVGGGAPIGIIGGREDILEQANLQKDGKVWIGGGTFSGNPVSMVAGKATLDVLDKNKTEYYKKLNDNGKKITNELQDLLGKYKAPAIVTSVGSMICIHWFKEKISDLRTGSEVKLNLDNDKVNKFQLLLFNRNILIRSGFGYLSVKHSKDDFEKTINALEDSIKIITQNS
ncbi:MAG: aminotransferase class III-fold pyridoxal phosphate-dependent enzyme [Asgard group archaeon]|nr:aminotransferase class III-fold pyridoxal phosphate-dependent enzyme [Asgard group archaeon]